MKRFGLIVSVIMMIAAAGIVLINVRQTNTDVTKDTTKVGFMLNGTIDDGSWGQAHYESMEKTASELNLQVDYRECVPENEVCFETIDALVSEGCEIIVGNSYGFGYYMEQKAAEYPDVYFLHAAGTAASDNMSSYFGRIYQMRYLCGIVAGLQTRSDEIGYVAAFGISEVNRGINAFTLGVKSVNPDATVYVEWTNSWIDDELTQNATESLFKNHPDIDVVTVHTDSLEAYRVTDDKGAWIIGYNLDNSSRYPEHFLTAATWHWDVFYSEQIMAVLQRKFIGRNYWKGIETGMIDIAPLTANVSTGAQEKVDEARALLESGEWDVFYGPIYDNSGKQRVAEGENMTDQVLLESFDWYVDGVVIDND